MPITTGVIHPYRTNSNNVGMAMGGHISNVKLHWSKTALHIVRKPSSY